VKTGFIFVDYILTLLGGHPPYVYFPVFPWIIYPLTGLSLGYYLKKFETSRVMYPIKENKDERKYWLQHDDKI